MKKRILIILSCVFVLSGCTSSTTSTTSVSNNIDNAPEETVNTAEVVEEEVPEADKYEGMQEEEIVIRKRIEDKYASTDITKITLNEDLGTDTEGDLIALVYLTWNVSNSGKTSKEMLSMYSSDLAATVASECPNIQEIAIFWEVPYLNDSAKCSYERKDDGMYEMDMVWGSAFN